MKEFKGAIFDLDGTIIDSMDVWETIDIKFLEKRNITMPNDYIEKINSMSFEEVAKYTIERFNLNESVDSLIKEWNDMAIYEYSNNIKLKPNVKEYLVKLKKHDIKIGLATSSPKELYEPVLKNNKVMLIDPKKCYKRSISYPRHLMKGLLKLQVLDEFLYYIKMIDKKRGIEWEERFKKYWEKEKHKKQKRKENNL